MGFCSLHYWPTFAGHRTEDVAVDVETNVRVLGVHLRGPLHLRPLVLGDRLRPLDVELLLRLRRLRRLLRLRVRDFGVAYVPRRCTTGACEAQKKLQGRGEGSKSQRSNFEWSVLDCINEKIATVIMYISQFEKICLFVHSKL